MKIAVTTASGNLGSAIIECLKSEIGAHNVIGIARTPSKASHLGVELRKGDYNSKSNFLIALQGVDALLLVSGMDAPAKRIGQHRNIIEAAKVCDVKRIVYTSIMGATEGNAFSPVVSSNRQTEEDIKASGLEWAIGRNGIYIEPDLEYIDTYKSEGAIINCAGEGKCGYTYRDELAYAYARLLTQDTLQGKVFALLGEPISQVQLAEAINKAYGTELVYKCVSVAEYLAERKAVLGDFLGTIIAGIYEGIRAGELDKPSDFERVAGRAHRSIDELIALYKEEH